MTEKVECSDAITNNERIMNEEKTKEKRRNGEETEKKRRRNSEETIKQERILNKAKTKK